MRIWKIRIQALLALRGDSEALAATERGIALAPHDGVIMATQGVALYRLGQLAEACMVSERAVTQLERQV